MIDEEQILKYQKEGHTFHCACRQVHGDGECECNFKSYIPGSMSRSMYQGICAVCLEAERHKKWCKHDK
jgi:hypothetical protein